MTEKIKPASVRISCASNFLKYRNYFMGKRAIRRYGAENLY